MKRFLAALFFVALYPLSLAFSGVDLDKADLDFKNRGEKNFSELTQLREQYKSIYSQGNLSEEDRIKVVTQMGRLDIYRGGLLVEVRNDVSIDQQKQAMNECMNDIELISDTNSAQYHFIKITCIAFRGKLESSITGRMKYGLKMRKAQGPAIQIAQSSLGNFEGGGIYRVLSAIRGNRKAKPLRLYDADEALDYANKALQRPEFDDDYYQSRMSGKDYFENYYYQAQAYVAQGIENEDINLVHNGLSVLKSKIKKINYLEKTNKLGERAPETIAYRSVMNKLKTVVTMCGNDADWKSCLVQNL